MCPPVPPAAMITRIVILDFRFWILDSGTEAQTGVAPIQNPKSKIQNGHAFSCFDTFSSTPAANREIASDEPPELMNGSGMPLVGTSDSVTLMLKNACAMII